MLQSRGHSENHHGSSSSSSPLCVQVPSTEPWLLPTMHALLESHQLGRPMIAHNNRVSVCLCVCVCAWTLCGLTHSAAAPCSPSMKCSCHT